VTLLRKKLRLAAPQLSADALLVGIRSRARPGLVVMPTKILGANFVVKESGLRSVYVSVRPAADHTIVKLAAEPSSIWLRGVRGLATAPGFFLIFSGELLLGFVLTFGLALGLMAALNAQSAALRDEVEGLARAEEAPYLLPRFGRQANPG
jgi:hypothetical protein